MSSKSTPDLPFGFNVIGYLSANLGMGVSARHFVRLLLNCGYPVAIFDVNAKLGRSGQDSTFRELEVADSCDLPYQINLFLLNITDLPKLFLDQSHGLFRKERLNVALPWWELTTVPERWIETLRLFDAILAGSEFIRHSFSFSIAGVPIIPAKHPVYLPVNQITSDRSRFGLPHDAMLFLSSFEPLSGLHRKNPFAAIAAFQRAFPDKRDMRARLVIKLNNANDISDKTVRKLIDNLEQIRKEDSRIVVIKEQLSYKEILILYASCNVFVSLHRAEGLGLAPLEAMRLGRPVIATGWSGNLSYMSYANSFLIPYELTSTEGDYHYSPQFLGKTAFWAEPDIGEAAIWMKALTDQPEIVTRFSDIARNNAVNYHREAERGSFIDEIRSLSEQRRITSSSLRPRYENTRALLLAQRRFDRAHLPWWRKSYLGLRDTLERHVLWRLKAQEDRFDHHSSEQPRDF